MTRAELQQLIDRLPESVLDENRGHLVVSFDDLRALNHVMIELAKALAELTREWMARERRASGRTLD
jgi:hypothetical protein